jgi:hypothetical protein
MSGGKAHARARARRTVRRFPVSCNGMRLRREASLITGLGRLETGAFPDSRKASVRERGYRHMLAKTMPSERSTRARTREACPRYRASKKREAAFLKWTDAKLQPVARYQVRS